MAVSILLVPSAFLIKGGSGVLFHYIGYNESTPVYTDAPYLNKKQNRNRPCGSYGGSRESVCDCERASPSAPCSEHAFCTVIALEISPPDLLIIRHIMWGDEGAAYKSLFGEAY